MRLTMTGPRALAKLHADTLNRTTKRGLRIKKAAKNLLSATISTEYHLLYLFSVEVGLNLSRSSERLVWI